jgi:hypothetical protein
VNGEAASDVRARRRDIGVAGDDAVTMEPATGAGGGNDDIF